MQIDIRTLLLTLAVVNFIVPASLIIIATGHRVLTFYWWCGISVISTIGAGLLALRGYMPDYYTVFLGQLIITLGFIGHNFILLKWIQRLNPKIILAYILILTVYGSSLYIIVSSHSLIQARLIASLLILIFLMMHRLIISLIIYKSSYKVSGKMIAMSALLMFTSVLFNLIHTFLYPADFSLLEPSIYQFIALSLMMLAIFLINFAYLHMLMQQVEIRNLSDLTKMDRALEKQSQLEQKIDVREQQFNELASNVGIHGFAAFSGAIAHEINQPLSAMLLNIDRMLAYLKKSNAEPKLINDLLNIKEDNNRSINIIKSIRLLLQDEKLNLPTQKIKIDLLVRDAVDVCKKDIIDNRVKFTQFYQLNGVEIDCDKTLLLQVVHNLITNAIKATKNATSPEINLMTVGDNNYVFVVLIDNGCGIYNKDTNEIFAPFRHGSINELHDGLGLSLGLGLSIIKSIVKKSHGDVGYFNNDGNGVTFVVGLPRNNKIPAYVFNEATMRQLISNNVN